MRRPPPPLPLPARRSHVTLPSFDSPSELVRVRGARAPPPARVLILPGNPGAAAFYGAFAERLAADLGGADVTVLSLRGHGGLPPGVRAHGHAPLDLAAQVDHAAAALTAMLHGTELGPRCSSPVVVIGHSIGATVAARAVAAVEAASPPTAPTWDSPPSPDGDSEKSPSGRCVAAAVALMPYARFDDGSPVQRRLRRLAAARSVAAAAASALAALPARAQRAALTATAGRAWTCGRAPDALLEFIKCGGAAHALALAADEFRVLRTAPAPAWAPYARLHARLAVIAAPNDAWFPAHHWAECRAAAPRAAFEEIKGVRHDFVTDAAATAATAAAAARLVRGMLA